MQLIMFQDLAIAILVVFFTLWVFGSSISKWLDVQYKYRENMAQKALMDAGQFEEVLSAANNKFIQA